MKRIIQSRINEHMLDLYDKVGDLKKDISNIKNKDLKQMSCSIYKIEKKIDKLYFMIITAIGALALSLLLALLNK